MAWVSHHKAERVPLSPQKKALQVSVAPFLILVPQKFPKNGAVFYYLEMSGG